VAEEERDRDTKINNSPPAFLDLAEFRAPRIYRGSLLQPLRSRLPFALELFPDTQKVCLQTSTHKDSFPYH